MNISQVNGTTNEILGNAKQKVGNLTGDSSLEIEGIVQQAQGNLQKAWGNAKDAVKDADEKPAA